MRAPLLLAATAALALTGFAAAQTAAPDNSHGFVSATRFGQRDGAVLYATICAGCHMPNGRGATGAGMYPPLAGNEKLEAAAYPIQVVVNGLRGMPGFASQLDDAQIAAVVNWVRTNLGNSYRADPARPEDVRAARQ
ncbi:MAG TPA: cytochrome c [Roseomonas sp.]|jgi:mono/diheme cytochrome c family protein